MFRQLHIFDTEAADTQLYKAYLINILVNFCGLSHIFYKIDFFFKD